MKKIVGVGNTLVDVLATLENDDILQDMSLLKGCMTLIDQERYERIGQCFNAMDTHLDVGGSAGNAMRALGMLGAHAALIGKVGRDAYADFMRQSLQRLGVEDKLMVSDDMPTGVASTFISADGERTFGTFLGAAMCLTPEELSVDVLRGYDYLFAEGYLVQTPGLMEPLMKAAHEAGCTVCLDLASANIVSEHHALFTRIIDNYVDIVFVNEKEAAAFIGQEDPREAALQLGKHCGMAVVKIGAKGSLVCTGTDVVSVEPYEARCIDTTGAGDAYAAGFLYGLANGYPLHSCGRLGSLLGAETVQVIGTTIPRDRWEYIRSQMALIHQS